MKKIILLAFVITLVSCAGAKKENETPPTPAKRYVCDSIETVTIDSITGEQIFEKKLQCDSVSVRCDSVDLREVDPKTGEEIITKVWRCDSNYIEEPSK